MGVISWPYWQIHGAGGVRALPDPLWAAMAPYTED